MNKILQSRWSIILLMLIAFLIYIPSLNGPFILDDQDTVVYNEVRAYPAKILDYSIIDHIRERTFSKWTFLINERLLRNSNASSFRLINYLFHVINGFLIYVFVSLLWRLTVNNEQSHIAGLIAMMLFIIHPIQTQAVNYITQRMTLLSSGFSLIAMILFLKIRTSSKVEKSAWLLRIGFVTSVLLAVFSKPIAVCIFPFILFLELLIIKNRPAKYQWLITMFLCSLGIIILIGSIPGPIDTPRISITDYLLTQVIVTAKYFGLVLWPINLSIDHFQAPWFKLASFKLLLSLSLHIILIIGVWLIRKQVPLINLGVIIIYVSFLPESGFIPLKDMMVEHRMYMPMIGIAILSSAIITPVLHKKWLFVFIGFISFSLMLRTCLRNFEWRDKSTLWGSALEVNPLSARAMYSIGHIYLLESDTSKAMHEFSKALKQNPRHVPSLAASALIQLEKGNTISAEKLLKQALNLEPFDVVSAQNMGYLLEVKNQPLAALPYYKRAVKFSKGNPEPYIDLGTLYLKLNRVDQSIHQFKIAINLKAKSARLHNNLGYAYQIKGQEDHARQEYQKALEINSNYFLAKENLVSLSKIKI